MAYFWPYPGQVTASAYMPTVLTTPALGRCILGESNIEISRPWVKQIAFHMWVGLVQYKALRERRWWLLGKSKFSFQMPPDSGCNIIPSLVFCPLTHSADVGLTSPTFAWANSLKWMLLSLSLSLHACMNRHKHACKHISRTIILFISEQGTNYLWVPVTLLVK